MNILSQILNAGFEIQMLPIETGYRIKLTCPKHEKYVDTYISKESINHRLVD